MLSPRMAMRTKANQVVQVVGLFPVAVKVLESLDVMYMQFLTKFLFADTTHFAFVSIALSGFVALFCPVGAVDVFPACPVGVFFAQQRVIAKLLCIVGGCRASTRTENTGMRITIPEFLSACWANRVYTCSRFLAFPGAVLSSIGARPVHELFSAMFACGINVCFWFGELCRGGAVSGAVHAWRGLPDGELYLANGADSSSMSMSKQTRSGAKPFPSAAVSFSAVFASFGHKKSPVGLTGTLAEGALFPTGDKDSVSVLA